MQWSGSRVIRTALVVTLAGVGGACSESTTEPVLDEPVRTLTLDASTAWAYADLQGDTAAAVAVTDATASTSWDLGFMATGVQLNGGEAGPGGMVAYCVCQNAGATDADILAFTAAGELPDFEAVTAAQIPVAASAWSATAIEDTPWYRYNLTGNHDIAPTYNVYLVKRGTEVYKIQIISYYDPAGKTRQITFRYVQLAD
jgi:hypothetical protein